MKMNERLICHLDVCYMVSFSVCICIYFEVGYACGDDSFFFLLDNEIIDEGLKEPKTDKRQRSTKIILA